MKAITYSSARQNMATTMDSVCDDHSPIIITRKNKRSVVSKPEPLKHALAGWWSRRINSEHRMVYRKKDDSL